MHPLRVLLQPLTRTALFAVPALLALCPSAHAANYYVDYAGGADLNAGTSSSAPWQHCPGDPAATGTAATISFSGGDTVFFRGGVTYVLTGATGITLRGNGAAGSPITYDGNSAGTWGAGRAKFSDRYGAGGIAAFSASTMASYVSFRGLEFAGMGGAATLPADPGSPVAARFGAGIVFNAGATGCRIEQCVFGTLGYAFNQKPMSAGSIAGTGIGLRGACGVVVLGCQFSRMAVAIDMQQATDVSSVEIGSCSFTDSVLWTMNCPSTSTTRPLVYGCTESNNQQFDRTWWTGYGDAPRLVVRTVSAGASVTFSASAVAAPAATFQWQKNGTAIAGATSPTLTFSAVTLADAATYTAVAANSAGSTLSLEAVLIVNDTSLASTAVAPAITTQPVSQTVAAAASVSFTAAGLGSPVPTYQWFKNGVSIAGATNTAFAIASVTSSDAAGYTMVATNSAGSATSNTATLTVSTVNPAPTSAPPAITTQPVSQTVAAASSVSFTAAASGSPAPTYQWFKNGVAIAGATNTTFAIASVTSSDAAGYTMVATNSAGSATSNTATLTVSTVNPAPTSVPPAITTQPASQMVAPASAVSFTAAASGSPAPAYQWFKNGVAIAGATNTTLAIASVTTTDAAAYMMTAANSAGSATSNSAMLTVAVAPVITTQPVGCSVANKATVTFTVAASGTPAPTYQWRKDGMAIAGATSSTLTLKNVSKGNAGKYSAVACNLAGSVTSNDAVLAIQNSPTPKASTSALTDSVAQAADSSRLINLSVRSTAGAGNDSLIVGFVVRGNASKPLLVRGVGPTLGSFGVTGAVENPKLSLYAGAALVGMNSDWSSAANAPDIVAAADEVGAFALPDASHDAALLTSVEPGAYTAQLGRDTGASGAALVELYDAASGNDARLVNLAVRTVVAADGAPPLIGFVVSGSEPKSLLIRAAGPSLGAFGVTDTLGDPQLEIFQGSTPIQRNDNWGGSSTMSAAFEQVGAFAFNDPASKDAAIIITVAPGAYTAVVSGANNTSGVVVVEVYELPESTVTP